MEEHATAGQIICGMAWLLASVLTGGLHYSAHHDFVEAVCLATLFGLAFVVVWFIGKAVYSGITDASARRLAAAEHGAKAHRMLADLREDLFVESSTTPLVDCVDGGVLLTGIHDGVLVQVRLGGGIEGSRRIALEMQFMYPADWHEDEPFHRVEMLVPPSASQDSAGPTGDPFFDSYVALFGPPAATLALMSQELRRAVITALSAENARIELGTSPACIHVATDFVGFVESRSTLLSMREAALTACGIVRRLVLWPRNVVAGLAHNVLTDPSLPVRQRNMNVLKSDYPDSEPAKHAAEFVMEAHLDPLRLPEGAMFGDPEGFESLARYLCDPETDYRLRDAALEALLRLYPARHAWPVLERALSSNPLLPSHEVLTAAVRTRKLDMVHALCDYALRCSPERIVLILPLVTRFAEPTVEQTAIALLARPSLAVRVKALQTLAELGTELSIDAVSSLVGNESLGGLASRVLQMITFRVGSSVEAGRLSLSASSAQAGALSSAAAEGTLEVTGKRA